MKALRASFEKKKPHTIGENLVLPAAQKIVEIMLDQPKAELMKSIPLWNDTVKRRIADWQKVQASPLFALQLDESTNVESMAHLMGLARYCAVDPDGKKIIKEDFLFC
ncbi:hypothetical protein FOCC_FOCC006446 [Frankliniella occidentalis]|nr:hypothetical protein FOCC_FOCC006446 [Frankliniella occidentalis]